MIGNRVSPALESIEDALLQNYDTIPNFTKGGFRAAIYIFQSVLMDKMFELFNDEDIPQNIREDMAEKCGNEIRIMVKKYTNIDTFDLYKSIAISEGEE